MNTPLDPDIQLTTPAELVAAVPYLVGYPPIDSLVIIALSHKDIAVTLRLNLPDRDTPINVAGAIVPSLRRNNADAAIIIAYGEPDRVTPVIDHVLPRFGDIHIVDAIRVTDNRLWSYICAEPSCCPPEGTPVAADNRVAAAFVAEGQFAQPNRDTIEATLDPVAPDTRDRVEEALREVVQAAQCDQFDGTGTFPLARIIPTIPHAAESAANGFMPTVDGTAELGFAIADPVHGQTAAIQFIDSRQHHGGLALWIWLSRHLSDGYRVDALALCAYAAWRQGSGVLAQIAIDIAGRINPGHRFAAVVALLLSRGVPPSSIPPFHRDGVSPAGPDGGC
ncbi:MAG: DUF4192 domain-containing protein [Stackebrandtia sp.]